jgi:hypothetical protein
VLTLALGTSPASFVPSLAAAESPDPVLSGDLGPGSYYLYGTYGVGCTPEMALSEAGCTEMFQVDSNVVVVPQ